MTYAVTCFMSDSLLFYLGPKLLSDYTYVLHVLKFIATVCPVIAYYCHFSINSYKKRKNQENGLLFYAFQAIVVKFYFVKQF